MQANELDILRGRIPLLDVRAPTEFAQGAIQGSTNLPILNDTERARVGTVYKQEGAQAATKLGHQLVSGDNKTARVTAWKNYLNKTPNAHIACWRGGQRSAIAQSWLAEEGIRVNRVSGGYKALRQLAITTLENAAANPRQAWWIVAGKTGTAKTVLINRLSNSIDLEGLANHRGSAFGEQATPQPSVATFENALAGAYLDHAQETLIVEDESRTIGRVAVPESWHDRMRNSPVVLIDADLPTRIAHIHQEYVTQALLEFAPAALQEKYLGALSRIKRRLGGARYAEVCELLDAAFSGAAEHSEWISFILREYYDPMYEYQLENKMPRIKFRGNFDEVCAYLNELVPTAA